MPAINVLIYCEENGSCPLLDWLDDMPQKVRAKCLVRIERLSVMGHELRRPEADYLRDGIYELRATYQGVHHRILYFFHGKTAAILSHGIVKESAVPPKEIDRAIEMMKKFKSDPVKHTYQEKTQ